MKSRARCVELAAAISGIAIAACARPALGARPAVSPGGGSAPLGVSAAPFEPDESARLAAPHLAEWRKARARLSSLRAELAGAGARTLRLSLAVREPYTGKTMEARGAVAIAPPHALRMILLGPGGTTALDLWAKDDRFRFAVPALDMLRRGDAHTPREAMRGLPVDFLRWWLLRPASGTLLWYVRDRAADRFVLRDGTAVVDLWLADDGHIFARRATWLERSGGEGGAVRVDEETVTADALGCASSEYRQASTGLVIRVRCEGVETAHAPNPRAFDDPDAVKGEGSP